MKAYHLNFKQKLPITLSEAWDFFSSPMNLSKITPPNMAFEVTSDLNAWDKMYPGMIITYKVSPFGGLKLNWMTEITQVVNQQYFIDEQRFGPFKFWHHQHHFEEIEGGVLMTDKLTYGLPFGIFGRLGHGILVKNRLEEIFRFREETTNNLFGKWEPKNTQVII